MIKFLLISLILACSVSYAKTVKFEGLAKNKKDIVIYLESHVAQFDGDKIISSETSYFDTDKKLIGELKSDYKKNIFIPDYTFKDFRNGMHHEVSLNDGKILVKARKKESEPFAEKTFEVQENMISGQGFNYFIRENLDVFTNNKNKDVKFLLPGMLDYFSFNIFPDRAPASVSEKPIITLKMAVSSMVLKLFVSTITLTYDRVEKRLMSYDGVSNLETLEGKPQDVKITYTYLK